MKKTDGAGMRFKALVVGFVLAGTALASAALTLGRARGAAWIGQPLDMLMPVQLDGGTAEAGLCADAEVFHGDSRQDASRVQVQVLASEQPDSVNLRITSSALIDEPVVTVYVRAGCSQKVSRKIVMLADFPSDNAPAPARIPTPVTLQVPTVVPAETIAAPSPSAAAPAVTMAPAPALASSPAAKPTAEAPLPKPVPKVANAAAPAAEKPEPKATPKPQPKEAPKELPKEAKKAAAPKKETPPKTPKAEKAAAAPAPEAKAESKPRLRLDPIETLNERIKTLESATTASTAQEELSRDGQRMEQLQSDLRSLLDQAVKNEASLAAMRERLEKAESDRVPVELVYALMALVLVCLGALVWLWSKRPRQVVWAQQGPTPRPAMPSAASPSVAKPTSPATSSPQADVEVKHVDADDSMFDRLMGEKAER